MRRALLQLILLYEAAVVLVDDGEGLLDVICALAGQTACLEERLVVEGVSGWNAPCLGRQLLHMTARDLKRPFVPVSSRFQWKVTTHK